MQEQEGWNCGKTLEDGRSSRNTHYHQQSSPISKNKLSTENREPHRRRVGSKAARARKWSRRSGGSLKKPPSDSSNTEAVETECRQFPLSSAESNSSSSDVDVSGTGMMHSGFENSAMKTSFSLSSLPPSNASLEGKQHAADRPFFSLRKKPKKEETKDLFRRSWGCKDDNKDDFWAALENNYQYLMDSNLIDSCKEADREAEFGGDLSSIEWSFEQFTDQFNTLSAWLDGVQEAIHTNSKGLCGEMQRKAYKRKVFNNQSGRLVARNPELKEEVACRVSYLNSKWERLEQHIIRSVTSDRPEFPTDIQHELKRLRQWIKETESRLVPLDFRCNWTVQELEEKARELEVVQKDVWLHRKAVGWLVKQCESYCTGDDRVQCQTSWVRGRRLEPSQAATYARGLERRWQLLYLKALEWQCGIDVLTKTAKQRGGNSTTAAVQESDEEPVTKHPRLSEISLSIKEEQYEEFKDDRDTLMEVTGAEENCNNCYQVGGLETEFVEYGRCDMEVERNCCEDKEVDRRTIKQEVKSQVDKDNQENNNIRVVLKQGLSPNVVRKLFDETSIFTRSDRNGPNCATFYFKHPDTESEAEVNALVCQGGDKFITNSVNAIETSEEEEEEEEWTYTVTQESTTATAAAPEEESALEAAMMASIGDLDELPHDDTVNNNVNSAATAGPRKQRITKLFEKAEEMILEEMCSSPAKKRASKVYEPHRIIDPQTNTRYTRVKEWLQHHPESKVVNDSCDASGECTTEDDEEGGSVGGGSSAQGLDATLLASAAILDSPSTAAGILSEASATSTPRVVMRTRKPGGGSHASGQQRPWSVSGPSGLLARPKPLPHSISESAIHQLSQSCSSGSGVRMDSSANNVSTLSSSTVEESTLTQDGGVSGSGYSSNSLRRRKVKLRKRSLMRKSDSGGSESVLGGASDATLASPLKLPALAKLSMRRASADRALDASVRKYTHTVPSPSSSGSDCESDSDNSIKQQLQQQQQQMQLQNGLASTIAPSFRLGPAHTLCSYASDKKEGKVVSADSSFSETAWDNYQEKYMSEAYSEEAADSEAARRILDFGDDYRTFLDSQSDCASSFGPPQQLLLRGSRNGRKHPQGGESDSELEDVWHLVKQSQSQLFFSEKVFTTQLSRASPHLVLASDFAELVTTCRDNINCLNQVLEKIEEGTSLLSAEECKDIRELISQWEKLEKSAEELQRERSLKREMAAMRDELLEMAARSAALEADLEDRDQLELRIQEVKGELSRLRDLNKSQLLQINLAVHRFLNESSSPSNSNLKDQVADLYHLWNDTYIRTCGRQRSLEEAGAAWQQFESHLAGLQLALRGDHEALTILHAALEQDKSVTPDLASSLRDIAKLLSEKQENSAAATAQPNDQQDLPRVAMTDVVNGGSVTKIGDIVNGNGGSAEGSLSDSGISDSGSEQELSEREKRLSGLRRLVRNLEAVLAPNSQAILNMSKRLEMTERELRGLQQTCRDLIVKTAVRVEAKGRLPVFTSQPISLNKNATNRTSRDCADGSLKDQTSSDESSGRQPRSWLMRVLRAAAPFHMVLVALFCLAYLLQPHCCDSLNNLNLSFTPHLRYLKGPPPI